MPKGEYASLLPSNWPGLPLKDVAALAPVEKLHWPDVQRFGVEVYCKRDELLHPFLSGNKFYKLYGHLKRFNSASFSMVTSFGGAYSNHLYALAAAAQELSIPSVGVIRGERPNVLGPTLLELQSLGMRLQFLSRAEYKRKSDPEWLATFAQQFPQSYVIPEGGGGVLGVEGCVEWGRQAVELCPIKPDVCCIAGGTGTAAAGVSLGIGPIPLHVFLALKGSDALYQQMSRDIHALREEAVNMFNVGPLSPESPLPCIETDYHCEGYAKFPSRLRDFMQSFEYDTGVLLDPVYTAKLFWGIWQKVCSGEWGSGTRILVLHSGGLQGRRGYPDLS